MKRYSLGLTLVITFLLISPALLRSEEPKTNSVPAQVMEKGDPAGISVKVFYFHGTRRCKTCLAIESNAKNAIEKEFTGEMTRGVITWQAIDTDQQENKHFEKDFDLMSSSLILVKFKDGKQVEWKNLQKVWELVWDEPAFNEYILKEMKAYLES